MSTTTMAPQAAQPQPAFGFTFPQSNDNNPFIVDPVSLNAQQPFDDFGFDFTSFTNFDSLPNSTNVDSTFGADAFQQYLNDTHAPSLDESTSTPTSTALVSPKSSLSTFDANSPLAPTSSALGLSTLGPLTEESALPSNIDIEALSKHHLERFLHYKALADEAQRKAEVNALAQQQADSGAFQALLAPFDLNSGANAMNVGPMAPIAPGPMHSHLDAKGIDGSMLLSYAAPPSAGLAPAGSATAPRQSASFAYDPVMAQASMAQAQADAHLQAHTAAAARVQQQRMQTQYWVDSARSSFDQGHQHNQGQASASMSEPAWSRSSFSSSHGGSSYPSTPQYVAPPTMPLPAPVPSMPMSKTVLPPLVAPIGRGTSNAAPMPLPLPPFTVAPMPAPIPMMNAGVPPSMPMMPASMSSSARSSSSTESLQNQKPILNPHGGGRGYIPGKTPDDPKKRHKCDVCGRGFARAFNLKSHMATHDPDRSKPHMCPHYSCKRGFSRLHDLERHRQGIHNDGPLVDAKTHGVTPSVARAQVRSQKSSSSTSTTTAADTMSMSMSASVSGSASPEADGYTGIGIANQPNLQPLQQ